MNCLCLFDDVCCLQWFSGGYGKIISCIVYTYFNYVYGIYLLFKL